MIERIKNNNSHKVAVVLPYVGNRILLQLRDFKPDIVFPGKWGFFSGSLRDRETPEEAARRELFEEIGYKPAVMYRLGRKRMPELSGIVSYSFFCPLTVPLEQLTLKEGIDLGLFTLEQIMLNKLYSRKIKRDFPVVPSHYIVETIRKFLKRLEKQYEELF